MTKLGLVLEGGGMRGMFTAGVLDVFLERGVTFDGAIGTSAGALFGCNLKSQQHGRGLRYNVRYCRDPRYTGIFPLLFTGDIVSRKFAYERVLRELDPFDAGTYRKNPMEFWAVCTDVLTGRPLYHRCGTMDAVDVEYLRASASMPLVSRVVRIEGHRLLDGGISDPIPLKQFIRMGYEKNVVILTQPAGYRKRPSRSASIAAASLRRYPAAAEAMRLRHIAYNQCLSYLRKEEARGRALLIRPERPLNIGHICHDPGDLIRVYEIGRGAAVRNMERIQEYLSENSAEKKL